MSNVDWSQFQKGDKARVTFEGEWCEGRDGLHFNAGQTGLNFYPTGTLKSAVSAELVDRPESFVPLPQGVLFKRDGMIFISMGVQGYRKVRTGLLCPEPEPEKIYLWESLVETDRASITILDI